MKIITRENNVIVYITDDETVITQNDTQTYIGEPVDCYFPEVTTSNSNIYEGVNDIPSSVKPNLYCYDGSSFSLNNEHSSVISMRTKRNELLAETDYFALSDVTMSAEMTTYRQALRDITTHANWPNLSDSDWPTKP